MLHKLLHHPMLEPLRRKSAAQVGLLILRIVVGTAFIYHGYPKLFGNTAMVVNFFRNVHIPAAQFLAPFVGCVEFFGGMLLILGLGVRPLGLALAIDMAVAILQAKGLASWKGVELEMLLLAASLDLLLTGAGEYGVDAVLMERTLRQHDAALPMKPGSGA